VNHITTLNVFIEENQHKRAVEEETGDMFEA
jgi:hypothetical protein